MGSMPEQVAKGPVLERLDAFSRKRLQDAQTAQKFANLHQELQGGQGLVELGVTYGIVQTQREQDHLKQDWFQGWWGTDVEEIVRQGFEKAFALAIQHGLPLDCYWVCAGQNGPVKMFPARSASQVTVLLMTPLPPVMGSKFPDLEDIWAVKHESVGHGAGEILEREKNDVITTRLKTGPH